MILYFVYNNFKQIVIILTSRIVITWLLLLGIANAKIDFQQQVIDVDYYSTRRPANDKTTAALSWVDYYQRSYVYILDISISIYRLNFMYTTLHTGATL